MTAKQKNQHEIPSKDKILRAAALRLIGRTSQEIGTEFGVARTTAGDWARDWPKRLKITEAQIQAEANRLTPPASPPPADSDLSKQESLRTALRHGTHTIESLCAKLNIVPARALRMLQALRSQGFLVTETTAGYTIHTTPAPAFLTEKHRYISNPGGYYKFGYLSDCHYCSKYAREDVVTDLYDWFAAERVDRVINTGNYIDGEARFNKHDIHTHGMQNQLDYFCKNYPQRTVAGKPLVTYIVSGDDHEGWYGQREGVDIGWLMEQTAKDKFGRKDLVNLGYIESFIRLQHKDHKDVSSHLLAVHPGGGSAYATSYAPQKYVECVPLDSEILTENGWKQYSEVGIGDKVLGYNSATKQCEWTDLLAVNLFGDQEVVTYANDNFRVRCTRGHRWAMELEARGGPNPNSVRPSKYSKRTQVMCTIDEMKNDWHRARIMQVAPSPSGKGFDFIDHGSMIDRSNGEKSVLEMTTEQRKAFIYGMLLGEGCKATNQEGRFCISFSQNPGPVLDAFILACALEGIATSCVRRFRKNMKGRECINARVTVLRNPMRMASSTREEKISMEDVWCPTTTLGTWVMRQDGVVTITGNSLQGGEKPAIVLFGHWHKIFDLLIRNVICLGGGCTKDLDTFGRKMKLAYHIGGMIVELWQDPNGAITRWRIEKKQYFDRGYYNDQWSYTGMPGRVPA